jgi:hypothetical protein
MRRLLLALGVLLALVSPAAAQSTNIKATDATTNGSVNVGDEANKSVRVTRVSSLPVYAAANSVSALNGDLVASLLVDEYKWFSLQITGTWVGTVSFQGSNDNTNWVSITVANAASTTAVVQSTTINGLFSGALSYRYLRVRMTSYTSGTATGALQLSTETSAMLVQPTIATQNGTWNVTCSNCTGSGASKVDDATFTIATDSVAPAGFLADQTSPDSVNEGDVGLARMMLNRIQMAALWDAAGNERGANVNASNELLVALSSVPTHAVTQSGTWSVVGTKTSNNAAPGAANVGVLGAIATAAAPTLTEGNLVAHSMDLSGNTRVLCANCSGSGATKTDDAAFSIASDAVAPAGFLADQTSPDSVNEGDVGLARMLLNRVQIGAIWDGTGLERGAAVTAANELLVAPGNTANTTPWLFTPYQGGANRFPTAAAIADNTANPTLSAVQSYQMCYDPTGVNWDRCVTATDGYHGSTVGPDGPRMMAESTDSLLTDTNVADGKDTRIKATLAGILMTWLYANPEDTATGTPVGITDGSSTQVIAAAGAGTRIYVTEIECTNTSSTNVALDIRDGTGGAVLWTMSCPANAGNNRTFQRPLRGSANTAVAADPSASASTITVSINGFKSKI